MLPISERRGRRSRGGRRENGVAHGDPVKHHIVVNDRVLEIIVSERKIDETNNECLLRMLSERTETIRHLRKKVDALEGLLQPQQETPFQLVP